MDIDTGIVYYDIGFELDSLQTKKYTIQNRGGYELSLEHFKFPTNETPTFDDLAGT